MSEVLARADRGTPAHGRWRTRLAPFGAGLLALSLVLGAVWVVDRGEQTRLQHERERQVLERMSLVRVRLESHLNTVIASARALSVVYATHPGLSGQEFTLLAREILAHNTSIINVGLARGMVLSEVYPLEGNEAAVGLSFRDTPSMWPAYERMIALREPVIAGPVRLVQGGMGIIVRLPVYVAQSVPQAVPGTFLGAISIPLSAELVLAQARLDELGDEVQVALRGRDGLGAVGEVFHGDAALFDGRAARQLIVLPGGSWEIAAAVRPSGTSTGLLLIRGLGSLLALVSGLTAWGLVRSHQRRAADERRVRRANDRFQRVLQALPDLLFEVDAEGCLHGVWTGGRDDLLLYPIDQIIGRRLAELMPADAYHATMAAVAAAQRDGHSRGQRIALPLGGAPSWFELSVARIGAPDEAPERFLALSRDVTARVQDEAELRIAATAFQSHEPLVITDAAHRIVRVNSAFTRATGYPDDEVIGRTPGFLKSLQHDDAFHGDLLAELASLGRWQGEVWTRRRDGSEYPAWLSISAVHDATGTVTHFIASVVDVTRRKSDEARIEQLAFEDPLTQLPNRRVLMDRLHHALAAAARSGQHAALLFIDLDNFKTLNDTKGHAFGDELLRAVADRLRHAVREGDTVARLGGDEFVVMLEGLGTDSAAAARQARRVGEKIRTAVAEPLLLREVEVVATCSIGVRLSDHQATVDDLLRHADTAMYAAKGAGRNAVRFFDPAMEAALSERAEMESDLRQALQQRQFLLHLQPQVDAVGRVMGAEVLLRWQHPRRGLVSPQEFIGLAEDTGLIHELGEWVLEQACQCLNQWADQPRRGALALSVNVSARQLHEPGFLQRVERLLQRHPVPAGRLKLELTESSLLDGTPEAVEQLERLKALGLSFSLDDFGTGYSSLQYLKRLPLDELKIDRSFTRDIVDDPNDRAIVRTIVGMAQSLNLEVIAEGVETAEQQLVLAEAGCRQWQGFLFGRPQPLPEFEAGLDQEAADVH